MSQMMLVTEYKTKPDKRDDLLRLFEAVLENYPRPRGQDFVVWSSSVTDCKASFLFEYWSEAENFADLLETWWYPALIKAVEELVKAPPTTTVSVPVLVSDARA